MNEGQGIISRPSNHSVPETLDRVEAVLRSKDVKIFARINHGAEATAVGLSMLPTELLIFGNAKGGTPVMLSSSTAAIDLPLKALAWQDAEGKVWLSYNDPEYIARRHQLTSDQVVTLTPITSLLESVVR